MKRVAKLELRNIVKYYEQHNGKVKAISNINLNVDDGEFVCLVGPSGCGKSTLLNIIAGLEKPDEGEIILDGRPVSGTSPDRVRFID
jgi:NitT/TauT family transport system ATP-binding protein